MRRQLHILHVPGADDERDALVQGYRDTSHWDVCVHEDPLRRGVMPNWLDAAQCALENDEQKWSLIIQDDADGCSGWEDQFEQATWFSPAPVLGLSYFGSVTASAHRQGRPYLVGPHLIWGAAVAYSRDFLVGLVPWAEKVFDATQYPHDDRLISAYAQRIGARTALATRALFDQPVVASTIGHTGAGGVGARRPKLTIDNMGPAWGAQPAFATKSTGGAPDQREWLSRLFTDNETDYEFVLQRKGAVRKVQR